MQWISVKERLPPERTSVLTYGSPRLYVIRHLSPDGRWSLEHEERLWDEEPIITHWAALRPPEPAP